MKVSWRTTCSAFMAFSLCALFAGCARSPEGKTPLSVREITFRIEFAGPISNTYYYFIAIDTTGGDPGPIPVFPGAVPAEGWVTGSATHYVQYHNHQYVLFKIISLQPFRSEPIGAPTRFVVPSAQGNSLYFTLDLNAIGATGYTIDVNVIAVNQLPPNARLIDGLGPLGTSFLNNLDISSDRQISNSDSLEPERQNDVLNENGLAQPTSDETRPLDITDWIITLDV